MNAVINHFSNSLARNRRQKLIKLNGIAEKHRVSIRNICQETQKELPGLKRKIEASATAAIKEIDELLATKTKFKKGVA